MSNAKTLGNCGQYLLKREYPIPEIPVMNPGFSYSFGNPQCHSLFITSFVIETIRLLHKSSIFLS